MRLEFGAIASLCHDKTTVESDQQCVLQSNMCFCLTDVKSSASSKAAHSSSFGTLELTVERLVLQNQKIELLLIMRCVLLSVDDFSLGSMKKRSHLILGPIPVQANL
ncbi:unnamed protein product [Ceratitis capitata]|uniref:(Mediterranean fruit fly) hypothetical protein n=1 Tax=Ceratitis capitata TaxID=7213 RepID=A0A811UQE6_CERCA|nr:unnamed protein product [Ceratitis capitata]